MHGGGLEQNLVAHVEGLGELLGPCLANRPLAVFHFAQVTLGEACQLGKLYLGESFFVPRSRQGHPWQLCITPLREE